MISFIVVSYKRPEMLKRTLGSLVAYGAEGSQLVVIDNESSKETQAVISDMADSWRIRGESSVRFLETNTGWIGGIDQGVRLADRPYLMFLNDDHTIGPNTVVAYLRMIKEVDILGYAGWKMLPSGLGKDDAQRFDYLHGTGLMMRKETFVSLGGFDPVYGIGYFEDADFCMRARVAGLRLAIVPDHDTRHNTPHVKQLGQMLQAVHEKNRREFLARWRSTLWPKLTGARQLAAA